MEEAFINRQLLSIILTTSREAFLNAETIPYADESTRLEHLTVLLRDMLDQLKKIGVAAEFDSLRINEAQVILIEGESSKVIACSHEESATAPINCLVMEGLSLTPFTQTELAP